MTVDLATIAAGTVDAVALAVATLAALVAGLAVRSLVRPRRSLGTRIDPYLAATSLPWWTSETVSAAPVAGLVPDLSTAPSRRAGVGPFLEWVGGARSYERWRRSLEAAGRAPTEARSLRRRHRRITTAGVAIGAVLGAVVPGGPAGSILLSALLGAAAWTREPGRLDRLGRLRRSALEAEAPRVAELLAVHLRAGHAIGEALRRVVTDRPGPLAADLSATASAIAGGVDAADAWAALARRLPDQGAARLARTLAASVRTGGDLAPILLALASDLRALRRHAVARRAVRRRTAMVAPLLLCIAPVMALFVAAALPRLVLG